MVGKDELQLRKLLLAPGHAVPKNSQNYYLMQHNDRINGFNRLTYCNQYHLPDAKHHATPHHNASPGVGPGWGRGGSICKGRRTKPRTVIVG